MRGARGYCLPNKDGSLALGTDGDRLHFVAVTSPQVNYYPTRAAALRIRDRWNSLLTVDQKKYGCAVKMQAREAMLRDYCQMQADMIRMIQDSETRRAA